MSGERDSRDLLCFFEKVPQLCCDLLDFHYKTHLRNLWRGPWLSG